jgi:hypothetical protein
MCDGFKTTTGNSDKSKAICKAQRLYSLIADKSSSNDEFDEGYNSEINNNSDDNYMDEDEAKDDDDVDDDIHEVSMVEGNTRNINNISISSIESTQLARSSTTSGTGNKRKQSSYSNSDVRTKNSRPTGVQEGRATAAKSLDRMATAFEKDSQQQGTDPALLAIMQQNQLSPTEDVLQLCSNKIALIVKYLLLFLQVILLFKRVNVPCKALIPHSDACLKEVYMLLRFINMCFTIGLKLAAVLLVIGPTNISKLSPDLGKP